WNVRAMPRWHTIAAPRPPISSPRKRTEPSLGAYSPAITLNVVLFPEPFGPIRPRISFCSSRNETLETAAKPPKRFVRLRTSSTQRPRVRPLLRVRVAFREREDRIGRADRLGPCDVRAAVHILHHDRRRALVLPRHRGTRREELDSVALDRAAHRD